MAKRANSSKNTSKKTSADMASVSPVRKTVSPRKGIKKIDPVSDTVSVAAPVLTHAQIAERAYLISLSGTGGSELDNWLRAEAELKKELGI